MYADKKSHAKYMKKYNRERYGFLKERGLCVQCGSLAVTGKTMCPECLDKAQESSERTRSEASKEQRRKYVAEKRKRCIERGICRECLKRNATVGKYCLECYVKRHRNKGSKRAIWQSLGRCYFCGAEVEEGYKTCEKHRKIMAANISKWNRDNSNHIWRRIQAGEVKNIQHWCKSQIG